MRRSIRSLAAAAALSLTLGAAGCGGDSITVPTSEGNVQLDRDGDTFKVETEDGSFSSGAGLPENFPDDVPLIDGEVISGAAVNTGEDDGWVVALEADASPTDVAAQASEKLTTAGYKEVTRMTAGTSTVLGFESEKWTIALSISEGDSTTVSYTVAKTGS